MNLLIGFAIGFTTVITLAHLRRRHIYQRQLEAQIPSWVNQANRQQPVVISLSQFEEEINFALWEDELEGADE